MAANNEVIIEEIEALQAIMMDDVNVHYNQSGQPNSVEVIVKPATADNIEEQHVRVTLVVNFPPNYPDKSPLINLRNPRGIDDDVLELIKTESISRCEEYLGLPVIYELIELVREKLTANNTPSCPCAICLFQFTDSDHFTKTKCFHYFHSNCLGRYILNCEESAALEERENQLPAWMAREERSLICPVCREPLNEEISGSCLLENPPPEEGELMNDFDPSSPEIKVLQENMMSLYLRQKSQGGIIDLEEEKNKFLISASDNIENLDSGSSIEENEDGTQQSQNKDGKQLSGKSEPQNHPQNNMKKGAKGRGGHYQHQSKKEYSSNNGWYGGNRGRYNKRGNKQHSGRNHSGGYDSGKYYVNDSNVEDKSQTKYSAPATRESEKHSRYNPRYQENAKAYDASYSETDPRVEETKKMGKRPFYKNFHHKGGGRGGSSGRGGPPPGFSELEKNVRPHATS